MGDLPSTIKEPRFHATCNHCDNSFSSFTMNDLYKHLEEHQIGIHFSDVKIISKIIEVFEYKCDICTEGFHNKEDLEEHKEVHCDYD